MSAGHSRASIPRARIANVTEMNRYTALRAGPAYNRLAVANDIADRFRPKKLAARPTLLDEEHVEARRFVKVRVEDLGDDRLRATVYVLNRLKDREAEQPHWVPLALQRRCAELAREALGAYADTEREWERNGAWCAEGTRRQLELFS